ncbi:hypothetical protein P153DRAFT_368543 [Dothidotthia symphoricarpi CBS 119687]|uniref:Essential protein Yae1 N-terminal domain-containing protein n=1 Tax=Dothidotthia symphoricarpi CBS 119687 TaxID=1392245 RepID=A0A6A6A7T2_9PLEO|nr:uncharacterized protein P153DRAFT_368543 [Dothidotthia symphoricarpi CBS 119687]KAF2127223.1 hypothetical protein P153DRAFT_368543 [Dothidotthia symphoricarpi CBS 119687]
MANSHQIPTDDPFDSLLTLEDTLYTTAYTAGTNAGALAGRIEGRVFGLENGFEKFAALGALHGRGVIWAARIPSLSSTSTSTQTQTQTQANHPPETPLFPQLPPSARLTSNTTLLHSLTDPLTFSTANTEGAVADFDDRLKRAGAKAKVIERIVGEMPFSSSSSTSTSAGGAKQDGDVDADADADSPPTRGSKKGRSGNVKMAGEGRKKGDDSMEDFGGSRFLR